PLGRSARASASRLQPRVRYGSSEEREPATLAGIRDLAERVAPASRWLFCLAQDRTKLVRFAGRGHTPAHCEDSQASLALTRKRLVQVPACRARSPQPASAEPADFLRER